MAKKPQMRSVRYPVNAQTTLSKEHHDSLLDTLMQLIAPAEHTRTQLCSRYDRITRDLAGFLQLRTRSEELAKKGAAGETTAVPDQRFPLAAGHAENIVTEVINTLFPARTMYGSTVLEPEEQDVAKSMVALLNHHGQTFSHYPEYALAIWDAVVYNLTVLVYDWRVDASRVRERGEQKRVVVREGNTVKRGDPYNVLLDWSVEMADYAHDAHFFADVTRVSFHTAHRKLLEGQWFGPAEVVKKLRSTEFKDGKVKLSESAMGMPFYDGYRTLLGAVRSQFGSGMNMLYKERPSLRPTSYFVSDCGDGGRENTAFSLEQYMNVGERNSDASPACANELLRVFCRIVPKDFGLSSSDEMAVWRFEILNGTWIVRAEEQLNAHGLIPVGACSPRSMDGELNSKSIAEQLVPFQDWISNVYNLYVKEMRKSVNNGMVMYDPKRVKLDEMLDPTSGWIPVSVPEDDETAQDRTVSSAVYRLQDAAPRNTTINDIAQVEQMMQAVMPTAQLESMSSLNRAVDHQSRTVANAAGRRTFHLAREISEKAVAPGMFIMTRNIVSNQSAIKLPGAGGTVTEINPEIFQDTDMKLMVSDGLRGVDNVSIANRVENMIRYALQSRRVQTEVDVLKMIAYLLHLEGANFSLEQFKYESPLDALGEEEKNMAFQLYQQAVAQAQGAEQQQTEQ